MDYYKERRELENVVEKAKKRIKEQLTLKGADVKGSARGQALSEIMTVFDKELEIGLAEELLNAKKALRAYYDKYTELNALERKIYENKKILEEQERIKGITSLLTDETLKNAVIAFNALKDNRDSGNAKEIIITYLQSKGKEELNEEFEKTLQEGLKGDDQ